MKPYSNKPQRVCDKRCLFSEMSGRERKKAARFFAKRQIEKALLDM